MDKRDFNVIYGDCLKSLEKLPDESVQCCITSPPYYGLRDYGTGRWEGGDPNCPHYRTSKCSKNDCTGHKAMGEAGEAVGDAIYKSVCPLCGAVRVDEQIGLEESPEQYIDRLVKVFHEVKRVLKEDGTLWVNIGDTYNGCKSGNTDKNKHNKQLIEENNDFVKHSWSGAKTKDLIGIPWMLAFALRADGWYLRQDIIWCLSGGEYIYAKTKKGVMPIMVRELNRLDISNVELWNGVRWVKVKGFQESTLYNKKIKLVLRSGERITCTDGHKWVLQDGTEKTASELVVGDVLKCCTLPDDGSHNPGFLTDDLLWLIGLYLAEGSRSDDCIQLTLNSDEVAWYDRIQCAVKYVGGTSTYGVDGNNLSVRIYSKVLDAILRQYISGSSAKNKHFNNVCWRLPNYKLRKIMEGYLDGDGNADGNIIRLGFTRNYYLERDFRIMASRLSASLTLNLATSKCNGKEYKSFRGEWRWETSDHHNSKSRSEIVGIEVGNARHFYDIEVDSDDHLFALASGVLTHNCKPNPMPESVRDRCTKSHEYLFLLSKSPKYLFNYEAIQEVATGYDGRKDTMLKGSPKYDNAEIMPGESVQAFAKNGHERWKFAKVDTDIRFGGSKYGDSDDTHFQTYSGNDWKCNVIMDGDMVVPVRNKRDVWTVGVNSYKGAHFATYPIELVTPCVLAGSNIGDTVLDPFSGSGTTGIVALSNGRKYIGCELNKEYIDLSYERLNEELFGEVHIDKKGKRKDSEAERFSFADLIDTM